MKSEVIRLYENRNDVTLTTYVIADSPEMLNGKPRPAVLICPGGAYLGCSESEGEPVALRFVSMGYHAFVLRYSVYYEGENNSGFPDLSKPLTVNPHCVHPTPMREIGKAMLIIREHAEEWHVRMDKIAVCGFSAGAHNAAMYATNWRTDTITEYFHEDPEKFRPAAAILCYTLSDYFFMRDICAGNPPLAAFFGISNTAFLGTAEPSDELLDQASPARHVTENTPPMFLWATSEDTMVPVQNSLIMARALADHHIPFEIHIFEKGPHGLSLADQTTASAKTQIYPDAAKWPELAGSWLMKRFALDLDEKTMYDEMMEKEENRKKSEK